MERLAALIAACVVLLGCAHRQGTVKIPRDDRTPPQSALDVVGQGKSWILTKGGNPVEVILGEEDSLVLIGLGMDKDGGVRDLALAANAVAICRGDIGDRHKSDAYLRRSVIPGFPPGVRVLESRSTRLTVRMADFRKLCPGGDLEAVSGAAGVRTVNFHGGSSQSPTVQFRFVDPKNLQSLEPAPSDDSPRFD